MERVCIALIMIHLSSSQVTDHFTEATVTREVQLGDTVTLHCNERHVKETVWHGQHCNKVPFIIIAATDKDGKITTRYFRGYYPRFRVSLFRDNNSISLEIANLAMSDLGLYYCTTNPGVPMLTGLGTVLVLAGNRNLSEPLTPGSNDSTVPTVGPEAGPRGQLPCWILPAILCPVCVVVGALLCSAYLHWKHCRKGLKGCETRNTSMDRNIDGTEEEVIYTALRIPTGKTGLTRKTLDTE
ncbi:hypothetical protein COCON_G00180750 [Conger conger]|uniref:Immunoglobulin domain-containing protein n=1 Tax=Conger conger TaxID=82655 RepID=A0A9Q1HSY5_CONCO|nr:hypothetical protein COCON_G00180750 [Conger conger]